MNQSKTGAKNITGAVAPQTQTRSMYQPGSTNEGGSLSGRSRIDLEIINRPIPDDQTITWIKTLVQRNLPLKCLKVMMVLRSRSDDEFLTELELDTVTCPMDLVGVNGKYPGARISYYTKELENDVEISADERRVIEHYTSPTSIDRILYYMHKLANHKRMSGGEREVTLKKQGYAKRLQELRPTEVQVYEMVEYFINSYEGDYFPNIAQMRSRLKKSR